MAPVSLVSINWENTRERNGCHAPLFSEYSSTSKCLLVRECDVALERYCNCLEEFLNHAAMPWYSCGCMVGLGCFLKCVCVVSVCLYFQQGNTKIACIEFL